MPYTNPVDLYHNKPKTKIVCTLGPSSDSEEVLRELVETGMNVARLNMSHGDRAVHEAVFKRVRTIPLFFISHKFTVLLAFIIFRLQPDLRMTSPICSKLLHAHLLTIDRS